MKLSILICALPDQWSYSKLCRLNSILDPQVERFPGLVEKRINDRPKTLPTGTKRNHLINDSSGEYFTFIDCDDIIANDYVETILNAINKQPDVITFQGHMTTDGINPRKFIIKLGSDYTEKAGVYLRWPNHLAVMKRSAVNGVRFPDIWKLEDYQWSKDIHDRKLLKTEIHLEKDMYTYDFISPRKRR